MPFAILNIYQITLYKTRRTIVTGYQKTITLTFTIRHFVQ